MNCTLSEISLVDTRVNVAGPHFAISPDESAVQQWDGVGAIEHSQVCAPAPAPLVCDLMVQYTSDLHPAAIREHLLRRAGFEVVSTLAASCWLPSTGTTFAALFCQTVKEEEALNLLALVHKNASHTSTIRLSRKPAREQGLYDCLLESPVAPARLVEEATKLRGLLRRAGGDYA